MISIPIKNNGSNIATKTSQFLYARNALTFFLIFLFACSCVHQHKQQAHAVSAVDETDDDSKVPGLSESRRNRMDNLFNISEEMRLTSDIHICQSSINFTSFVLSTYNFGFMSVFPDYYVFNTGQRIAAETFNNPKLLPKILQDITDRMAAVQSEMRNRENEFLQGQVINAKDSCRESISKIAFRVYVIGLQDAFISMLELNDIETCVKGFMSVQRLVLIEQEEILKKHLQTKGPVLNPEEQSLARERCLAENSKEKRKSEQAREKVNKRN